MCKQGQRRYTNNISSNTKQSYNKHPNIKLETIYLSFQLFSFFLLILYPKISPMYTPSTIKNLISIQFLTTCSIERHKNSHSAKQKQRKRALFWCSEFDLTDRTHLRVQYTNSCGLSNPVK